MTKLKGKGPKYPDWFEYFVNNQFLPLVKKVENIEQRLDRLEQRMDKLEQRMDKLEQRMDKLEQRIDNLVQKNNLVE